MRLLLAILFLGVLLLPSASHAQAVREIDSPVLTDDDGLLEYGGCTGGSCAQGFDKDGLDLQGLDVREAFLPDGQPTLCFRVVYSWLVADVPGRDVQVTFLAGSVNASFSIESADRADAHSTQAALVVPPVMIQGTSTWAVEAWLPVSTFNLTAGGQLGDIRVTSSNQGTVKDLMPGTWRSGGQDVPHVPHSTDVNDALGMGDGPGSYTLKGPAPLLLVEVGPRVANDTGPAAVTIVVRNPLATMAQSVNVLLNGAAATVTPAHLELAAGGSASIKVTGVGRSNATLISGLGAWTLVPLELGPAPVRQESPGLTVAPLVMVLGLVLALRRRRAGD